MKKLSQAKKRIPIIFAAVLAAALISGTAAKVRADEPTAAPPAATNAIPVAATQNVPTDAARKKLTGAELYSIHCNRCHAERYPTERTAAQWKTVMLHMQVRASIPGSQARLILQYLQDNSGR